MTVSAWPKFLTSQGWMCNAVEIICGCKIRGSYHKEQESGGGEERMVRTEGGGKLGLPAGGAAGVFIRTGNRMSGMRFTTWLAITSETPECTWKSWQLMLLNCVRSLPFWNACLAPLGWLGKNQGWTLLLDKSDERETWKWGRVDQKSCPAPASTHPGHVLRHSLHEISPQTRFIFFHSSSRLAYHIRVLRFVFRRCPFSCDVGSGPRVDKTLSHGPQTSSYHVDNMRTARPSKLECTCSSWMLTTIFVLNHTAPPIRNLSCSHVYVVWIT